MTPNDQLMEQCRREAEETYVHPEYNEARIITTADTMIAVSIIDARREAYAAALFHERSKPRLTVEEVMEVVRGHHFRDQHPAESADTYLDEMYDDLRARLTEKLNQKNND